MTADGYSATYDSGETSEAIVDILVGSLAAIFSFATLIGLILLYKWAKKSGMPKL